VALLFLERQISASCSSCVPFLIKPSQALSGCWWLAGSHLRMRATQVHSHDRSSSLCLTWGEEASCLSKMKPLCLHHPRPSNQKLKRHSVVLLVPGGSPSLLRAIPSLSRHRPVAGHFLYSCQQMKFWKPLAC
jgi:hypothetical protein